MNFKESVEVYTAVHFEGEKTRDKSDFVIISKIKIKDRWDHMPLA